MTINSLFNKLNKIVDKIDSNTFSSSDYKLIFKTLEKNKFLLLKARGKDYFNNILGGISLILFFWTILDFASRYEIYSKSEIIIACSILVLVPVYWLKFFPDESDVYSQRFILLNFFKNNEFKLLETIANEEEEEIIYEKNCISYTEGQITSIRREYTEYYRMRYDKYSFTLEPYIKTTCYCKKTRSNNSDSSYDTTYKIISKTYGEIIIIFDGTAYEKIFEKIALLIEGSETEAIERLLYYDYGFTIKFNPNIFIYSYQKLKKENELISYQIEASIMEPISILDAIKTLNAKGFVISIKKRLLLKDIFLVSKLEIEHKVKDISMFPELVKKIKA